MDDNSRRRNERLAQTVIKGLQSRNMSGYYAENKEDALKQALELIPEGSTIAMGGCMSAHEIGLIKALEAGNYHYIDRDKIPPREGLWLLMTQISSYPVQMPLQATVLWSTLTETPTVFPVSPRDQRKLFLLLA